MVTTLTCQGQVTSPVTWPFDTQGAISYRCSIITKSLSPAVFKIINPKHIGITTLTFLGHLTSSNTHTHTQTRAASDFMVCPMQCIALDRQQHADKNDKNDDIVQCGARSGASCWYWQDCRQIFYARRQLPHCTKLIIHALFLRLSADFGASPLDYFF